jgi:FMN phosphatase YigB (HAD superfamily)
MASTRVVIFDVGDTLVSDGAVIDGVPEALEAIGHLGAESEPIETCIVSDFTMPDDPTPETVQALFAEYCDLIRGFGLEPFFSPLDTRATISTQAGVTKPDRRIFELALQRLGLPDVGLADCTYVSENESQVLACRELGMIGVLFRASGSAPAGVPAFGDWRDAPDVLAAARTSQEPG